jgi:uncharacterized protein (DUF1697 family)
MATHIALLRAVNLGPHGRVAMADLRKMFEELGFSGAQTLIASGNVAFEGGGKSDATIEALLEKEAAARLGLKTDFFVRKAAELRAAIKGNPFPAEAKDDPGHLVLMFMKKAPAKDAVAGLQAAIQGRESVAAIGGREGYVVYPDGIGRSKLGVTMIEKHLGSRGTGRNWNTVLKLAAMVR